MNLIKKVFYIEKLTIASFHDGINIGQTSFPKSLVDELNLSWDENKKDLGIIIGEKFWKIIYKKCMMEIAGGSILAITIKIRKSFLSMGSR